MKKIILAAFLGGTLGIFTAVKLTGPVLAENNSDKADVYEPVSYTHLTLPTNREV